MANVLNTLYPPQVSTFMNAFVNTENAIVYYSLSPYNDSTQIKRVHISVTNQLNNENALQLETGIIISEGLEYDTTRGMYRVEIPYMDIIGGSFNINQFYKVQLRFDCYDGDQSHSSEKEKTAYLLDQQNNFSEWSSVCLIRPILQPSIALRQFDSWTEEKKIAFNKGIVPISGKVFFGEDENNESETLQSYQLKVYNAKDELELSSPVIYTGDNVNPNDINYKLDTQTLDIQESVEFRLVVSITTKNQYALSKSYDFQIADFYDESSFHPTINLEVDNDTGVVSINIKNTQTVFGTLYVKRASSINDFKDWDIIYSAKQRNAIDLTLKDNTVASLVWYRYAVQLENSKGNLSRTYNSTTILPDFYDVFLSKGNKQIGLKYDYKISSFKPVVNRSKIDTLGGKYPKFAENAVLNYKQFSISATISAEMDPYQMFLSKSSVYTNSTNKNTLYSNYKANHEDIKDLVHNELENYDISSNADYPYSQFPSETSKRFITTTTNDWMWEREFRDNLTEWLNDGEPKLYRSMAEGNMVVMLTDVSLSPKTQLGRRLWDFSATVYEVADATSLDTLDNLGIYERTLVDDSATGSSVSPDPEPEYLEVIKVGQLYRYTPPAEKTNIVSILLQDLKEKYGGVLQTKKPDDLYLKNIKIFYHNRPNIFLPSAGNFNQVNDPSVYTAEERSRMVMGYTFNLQVSGGSEQLFFVNERGYYQVPNILDVIGLYFNQTTDLVTIEYTMVYKEKNDESVIVAGNTVERIVVGQETGTFNPNIYQGERIRRKYNFVRPTADGKETDFYEKMTYWKGICLDVTPFAVAHIQYEGEETYHDYVVGETGVLHMLKDMPVKDICFVGVRMRRVDKSRTRYLKPWEYVQDDGAYTKYADIKRPKNNTVYTVNNKIKIYYNDVWYDFKEVDFDDIENNKKIQTIGIAAVPVQGAINYYGNIIKSTL